jgi:hypothetical protein
MRHKRHITAREAAKLAAHYRRSGCKTATARAFGVCAHRVGTALARYGYAPIVPTPRVPSDLVHEMHRDYRRPMSLAAVARMYGRKGQAVRELFVRHGLTVRPATNQGLRGENGQILPAHEPTAAELSAMIAAETKVRVPAALKSVWRSWSLARRGAFLRRLRARLRVPVARDRGPYSSNVTPFDYASPEAQALCAKLNDGTNSRTARCKIDLCSEGVIFEGGLWFWNSKVGYQSGPWHPGRGRLALHHVLWERWNGRAVPAGHVLRYRDGNPNNLVAANLSLVPRDELARENQGRALTRKSRALTKALLGRVQNERQDDDVLSKIRNRSAAA